MERINYGAAKATWQTVTRTAKDGTTTEQQRVILRYYVDGKRKGKTKVFPASRVLDTDRKRDNALRQWVRELEAEQDRAIREERQRDEEREAARAEAERIAREAAERVNLIEYMREYIDVREAAQIIEASTASDYRHTCKRLEARFADTSLQELTSKDVQDYEAAELKRGVSATTVGKVHRLLKQVITYAVRHEVIEKNVMLVVEPPKRPKHKPNGLDVAEAQRVTGILLEQPPTAVSTAALLALHASLRAGEVCGLTWANVDLDNGIIRISQAIGLADGRGAYIKATKNDSSTRDVNITADLTEKLRKRRDAMRADLRHAGLVLSAEQFGKLYVCGTIDGRYPSPQVIARKWAVLAEAYNVMGTEGKRATFHTLRHGFATVGIASGIDVASIAAQMGHSTVSQTLNTYTSATADGKRRAASTMGEVMHPVGEADVISFDKTGTTD
jgi:integrase